MQKLPYQTVCFYSFHYFLEGLPYGIQSDTLPIIFRSSYNFSLSWVTFSKISLIPWLLKPLVAKKVQSVSANQQLLAVALVCATIISAVSSIYHDFNYNNIIIIQFLLHSAIASMDISVDYLQHNSCETPAQLGILKSIEVCFYKLGAYVAGAFFLTFSTDLSILYTIVGCLYLCGFICSRMYLKDDVKPTNSEKQPENNKPVKLFKNHYKLVWFLLVQKLFGTAFRSLFPMFLVDQKRLSTGQIAMVTGTLPLVASTFGSFVGGLLPKIFP